MEPKTGKRIVSKGKYAFMKFLAICLSSGVVACTVGVFLLLAYLLYSYGGDLWILYHRSAVRLCFLFVPPLLLGTFLLLVGSCKSWKTVRTIQPLTRANTEDLPALDSLVRASEQPMQAQEAVLLRAAAEGQETPPEQLVRASVGQE